MQLFPKTLSLPTLLLCSMNAPAAIAAESSNDTMTSAASDNPSSDTPTPAVSDAASERQENPPTSEGPSLAVKEQPTLAPSLPEESSEILSFRRVFSASVNESALERYEEAALGLAAAGALFGLGFAADGSDQTWAHALWIASGVTAVGSFAQLFLPSELEKLATKAHGKSAAELRDSWREIATYKRRERRMNAVLGGLVGVTSTVFGALVLTGELGELSDDTRRIFGSALAAGGGLALTRSAIDWFVPTSAERGYALVENGPRLEMTATPTPSGFALGMRGVF